MTKTATAIALLLSASGAAMAQDSVTASGVSDALSPYESAGQQGANYVVTLSPFNTSWGTQFGIAPVLKTTQSNPAFNNNLGSAQAMSRNSLLGVASLGGTFQTWTGVGGGINANANQTSSTVNALGTVNRQALAFKEFDGEYDGVIAAMVEFDPANPSSLFVSRRHAAQSLLESGDAGDAAIGGVSVSNTGDVFYRADSFQRSGLNLVVGNNLYSTNFMSRNTAIANLISGAGPADASQAIFTNFTNPDSTAGTLSVPSHVPGTNIAGTGTFRDEYAYGSTAGSATVGTSDAHLDGLEIDQHRGSFGSTTRVLLDADAVATFGVIGRDSSATPTDYSNINLFSVDANGAQVGSPVNFPFPDTIADFDASAAGYTWMDSVLASEPATFRSQTAFQGGVGQVAVGADQEGRGLAAFYVAGEGAQDNPDNHMMAVRFDPNAADPSGASAEYGLVAWCYFDGNTLAGTGKPITDGAGNTIGQLVPLDSVTGGTPFGPSFSPPAIDAAGNIWFQGAVELFNRIDTDDDGIGDASDFDGALLRAVYDADNPSGPAWELELVLELGTVITGLDSGVAWQITFMGTADSDSLSSGTFFSSNAAEDSFNGFDVSGLPTSDSRTSGGVVVNASITYDVDGDGDYEPDPAIDPGTTDQDYNALLYIGNLNTEDPAADPCDSIDFNGDGILDNGDIGAFVQLFLQGNLAADVNGDGILDNGDIGAFVQLFLSCVG
ncbi:MAG: GC-type dockerin domain-anchored protein [Phycisphaerales bacterium JB040]